VGARRERKRGENYLLETTESVYLKIYKSILNKCPNFAVYLLYVMRLKRNIHVNHLTRLLSLHAFIRTKFTFSKSMFQDLWSVLKQDVT
jgi:hypothetical protein